MENKIKVLSLFDGNSCTQVALSRMSINYEYYASEIDQEAIKITQHHFPITIQLGDITQLDGPSKSNVDLLIVGSPCTNLSSAGNKKGLLGEESKLFYDFIEPAIIFLVISPYTIMLIF